MRFFLIDTITSWDPGKSGVALKNVSLTEDFFDDHFPLMPVMPGVLMVEGMAQLAGLVLSEGVRLETGRPVKAIMGAIERAKFRQLVKPGDSVEYRAEILSTNEASGRAHITAQVNGQRVADCTLLFTLHPVDNPSLDTRRNELLALWLKEGSGRHVG